MNILYFMDIEVNLFYYMNFESTNIFLTYLINLMFHFNLYMFHEKITLYF